MSKRKIQFASLEFYHIYNRGNSKQIIYKDVYDYQHFQTCLFVANGSVPFVFRDVKKNDAYEFERGEQLVYIGAYALMPNHFHLLLTPAQEGGIQKFMQKLSTSYSLYFNNKYDRVGGLFEGRFKSEHAHSDEYLKYLFSYIHLNPIKLIQKDWKEIGIQNSAVALQYLEDYTYSSFNDYSGVSRVEGRILNREVFPNYFTNPRDFRHEIFEWITYNNKS